MIADVWDARMRNWGEFSAHGTGAPGKLGRGDEPRGSHSDEDAMRIDRCLARMRADGGEVMFELLRRYYVGKLHEAATPYHVLDDHMRRVCGWKWEKLGDRLDGPMRAERWHVRGLRWVAQIAYCMDGAAVA